MRLVVGKQVLQREVEYSLHGIERIPKVVSDGRDDQVSCRDEIMSARCATMGA
ncbi:MAG TPA: hypothetical protein VGJ12_15890 [Gemmatimonadaceae bacterium]